MIGVHGHSQGITGRPNHRRVREGDRLAEKALRLYESRGMLLDGGSGFVTQITTVRDVLGV